MNKLSRILLIGLVLALLGIGVGYFVTSQPKDEKSNKSSNQTSQPAQQPLAEVNPQPTSESLIAQDTPPEQKVVAEPDYDPAIWKVEHNGVTSYLFGSIHMGDQSMYPLPEQVRQAYAESDVLVVEIDLNNLNQLKIAQTIQQMAVTPEKSLKDLISEDTAAKYDAYCQRTRSPCAMFSTFEPWFVAASLEALNMQQQGYQEQLGIDKHFLSEAKDNKDIVELESFDSQLAILDGMPLELQELMLLGTVTRDEGGVEKLIKAWKTGDVETYLAEEQLSAKDQGVSEEDYAAFMDLFLYQRNQGMADGIAELLEQGKSAFVVVGAAHYGGEKSVNYYLEQKGFKVTRM
jgi:uncharacterized protein YbaP (TraB family)